MGPGSSEVSQLRLVIERGASGGILRLWWPFDSLNGASQLQFRALP